MSGLLIIGTIAGAVLGTIHALGVYARRLRDARARGPRLTPRDRLRAAYFSAWTVVLWTAFGSYVLILWLIALPLWLASRLFSRPVTSAGV